MPWHALVGVFYDDGIYLALAKSLAEGHGYRLQYLPGAPAAVHYPFAYPAFLAVLWKLWPSFPANVAAMRAANGVLMGLAAALMVAHLAPRIPVSRWITALAVLLAATAVPMIAVATVLFSEPLFLVLATGACWAADAASDREQGGARLALSAGTLAGLATLTRSIGITVIAGVLFAFAVRRRWRDLAIAAAPAFVLVLPWMLWSGAHHAGVDPLTAANYGTYGDLLRQGGTSLLSFDSLLEMTRPLGAITLPPIPPVLRIVLGLNALVILFAGFAALTKLVPSVGGMLWCYLAIIAVWPYAPDRFLWGVLPWLAVAFVAGVKLLVDGGRWTVTNARPSTVYRLPAIIAAATVVTGFSISQVRGFRIGAPTSMQVGISGTMNEILPWIRSATDSSSVIAGEDEALIWLYTGRRAVPSFLWRVKGRASESFGPDSLHAWLGRTGATHMILTGPGSEAAPTIDELLAKRPGYLELVRVWPGRLFAFRIHPGA